MKNAVKESADNRRVGFGLPGPGRPKGVPNKLTVSAKEAFQHAFEELGGAEALAAWAKRHPEAFFRLYARQLRADLPGAGEGPLVVVIDSAAALPEGYVRSERAAKLVGASEPEP